MIERLLSVEDTANEMAVTPSITSITDARRHNLNKKSVLRRLDSPKIVVVYTLPSINSI